MSIGSVLAQARRSAGLTVAGLSAHTRIREALIHAIERDDFSQCGGDFYARGHVRNMAKALGLDPEAVVHEYDELHGGVPLPVRAASVFQADTPIKIRESRSPNWTMAMGVALAIVVVFGVVKTMGGRGETPTAEVRPAAGGRSGTWGRAEQGEPGLVGQARSGEPHQVTASASVDAKTLCAAKGEADTLSGWSRACTATDAPASTRDW
ncbi:helix-turn-helix domain-containing protein [Streptosporangium algeriense]|uniref:Helix-turn-helix domain-containing protein n=1 Tax=Streptosporangium algeriense TaxID=1682748 RepID=A0ABW3DKT4_9ACTN